MRTFHCKTAAQFNKFLMAHVDLTKRREAQLYTRIVNHTEKSMRFGSSITGAPGQPFRTGNLRDKAFFRTGTVRQRNVMLGFDVTIAPYVGIFEDRLGDITLRSQVGGFHSIKITFLNFRRLADFELAIVRQQIQLNAR